LFQMIDNELTQKILQPSAQNAETNLMHSQVKGYVRLG
jgi:hypothetical protein